MQRQKPLLVFVSGVAPAKRYLILNTGNEPAVRNRNAMGVGAEITKRLLRSAERWFAIDHRARRVKLADQTSEQPGLSEAAKQPVEL